MTKDELRALPPEKVNELAAEKVMGWHLKEITMHRPEIKEHYWYTGKEYQRHASLWTPMTSIADAWLLLDALKDKGVDNYILEWSRLFGWEVDIWKGDAYFLSTQTEGWKFESAPAAITLACVAAAMEVE